MLTREKIEEILSNTEWRDVDALCKTCVALFEENERLNKELVESAGYDGMIIRKLRRRLAAICCQNPQRRTATLENPSCWQDCGQCSTCQARNEIRQEQEQMDSRELVELKEPPQK